MTAVQRPQTPDVARWNVGLTVIALLVIGVSFVFRLRGGDHNAFVDLVQVFVICGYLLVTPVICVLAWRARKTRGVGSATNLMVFAVWFVVVVGSMFVHL